MRVEEALDRIQWEALVIFGVESKRSRLHLPFRFQLVAFQEVKSKVNLSVQK